MNSADCKDLFRMVESGWVIIGAASWSSLPGNLSKSTALFSATLFSYFLTKLGVIGGNLDFKQKG